MSFRGSLSMNVMLSTVTRNCAAYMPSPAWSAQASSVISRRARPGSPGAMQAHSSDRMAAPIPSVNPLSYDPVSGGINWPMLLRGEDFADQRSEIEKAFAKRAGSSMMSEEDYMQTKQATEEMAANLKKKIRDVPSYKYMQSKKFIDSLAYAAGQPSS